MVNMKIHSASAKLTPPSIPLEHLLMKPAVGLWFQSQAGLFRADSLHAAACAASRNSLRISLGRNFQSLCKAQSSARQFGFSK